MSERKDYSRSRHTHRDDVTCEAAGDKGHPPRWTYEEQEEADALAEKEFIKPMNPDPLTQFAKSEATNKKRAAARKKP